jgi:hypothetical protein
MTLKHPAKFSAALYPVMADMLRGYRSILDPFAGVGGVFRLHDYLPDLQIAALEIEPEWVTMASTSAIFEHGDHVCAGDARQLPWTDNAL